MEEKELIDACSKNDQNACTFLFNKYAPQMLMVCTRYMNNEDEAKDILQEGFIKVFESIKTYKAKGSFEGWIRRIMINEALNSLRKKKKLMASDEPIDENIAEPDNEEPVGIKGMNFSQEELLTTLQSLPEPFKIVFNLYCFEKYSHKEIAKTLSIKTETSRSRLLRARIILQKKLVDLATKKVH
ncbi:RNA polymerase sigma factor [Flammeovirgaceae bacterium SG7u.111]|nr:RNA polymerase sigma factor [Flammeovirgaceae bacterium SG7u.132]WPO38319.1 RNA polymerase sigma factor [Flammeovirgaceae bacterium SG7u.111]